MIGLIGTAAGRAQVRGKAVPRAAAQNAKRRVTAGPGRSVRGRPRVALVPRVLYPSRDIALHVVKAEPVRRKRTDRNRLLAIFAFAIATLRIEAGLEICLVGTNRVANREWRGRSAAGPVFPFGFRQQAVSLSGGARQPYYVFHRIVPGHVDDRLFILAPPFVDRFRIALTAAIRHAGIPFGERHLEFTDREGAVDRNESLRPFVDLAIALIVGRAHHETRRRDRSEEHTSELQSRQ